MDAAVSDWAHPGRNPTGAPSHGGGARPVLIRWWDDRGRAAPPRPLGRDRGVLRPRARAGARLGERSARLPAGDPAGVDRGNYALQCRGTDSVDSKRLADARRT